MYIHTYSRVEVIQFVVRIDSSRQGSRLKSYSADNCVLGKYEKLTLAEICEELVLFVTNSFEEQTFARSFLNFERVSPVGKLSSARALENTVPDGEQLVSIYILDNHKI